MPPLHRNWMWMVIFRSISLLLSTRLYTMAYFGEDLRPYWNKDGKTSIEDLYADAEEETIKK